MGIDEPTADFYNRVATDYERRWKGYLQHTHDRFLDEIRFSETDDILDLSCGTGLLASMILERELPFSSMVLNDPADNMRAVAEKRLPKRDDLSWSGMAADQLDVPDRSFDRVFSLNALHHYAHQDQVFAEIKRVLRPGGSVCLLDWNRSGWFIPVDRLIRWWTDQHFETRSLQETSRMVREHHFDVVSGKEWRYRYWNLFYLEAVLPRT